jgi:hypothetical protein
VWPGGLGKLEQDLNLTASKTVKSGRTILYFSKSFFAVPLSLMVWLINKKLTHLYNSITINIVINLS